ncbi:LOW QUALITY PROTEIN: Helitron helicase-like protein [Phytophthora palmivora]|uniref:Helitron helicase-like protein n=1 Tax=Phytophthora palmivora TaxID=4796 RepID=A0A2P4XAD4_9STRA|nr:LOW QUALITY PROTEIN: Helitron helicase-like protein [Phytophthora palmivora]
MSREDPARKRDRNTLDRALQRSQLPDTKCKSRATNCKTFATYRRRTQDRTTNKSLATRYKTAQAKTQSAPFGSACPCACKHKNFDKTRVGRKNVTDGRHYLRTEHMFKCIHCGVLRWTGESKMVCCLNSNVQLPPLKRHPEMLLFTYMEILGTYIRDYNQVFVFTSIGVSRSDGRGYQRVDEDTSVQGQQGQCIGRLYPELDDRTDALMGPQFAQIYIYDPDTQQRVERRRGIFAELDPEVLVTLEMMIEAATTEPNGQAFPSQHDTVSISSRSSGRCGEETSNQS